MEASDPQTMEKRKDLSMCMAPITTNEKENVRKNKILVFLCFVELRLPLKRFGKVNWMSTL